MSSSMHILQLKKKKKKIEWYFHVVIYLLKEYLFNGLFGSLEREESRGE